MSSLEKSSENPNYLISGIDPADLSKLGAIVLAFGGTMIPVDQAPLPVSTIQTVTLDDIMKFGDTIANTPLEAQRNPTTGRKLWSRSQELVAAREAHQYGIVLNVTYMSRTAALPHSSPLKFIKGAKTPSGEQTSADDWHDWSLTLDELTVASLQEQLKLIRGRNRTNPNPLGVGVRTGRIDFLEKFVTHITDKQ